MQIGGLRRLSLIDYPGKLAAVIFTQGCDFRCPYCHNPELVLPEKFCATISQDEILDFLRLRKEVLEGVVISGGEPTIQKDLILFLDEVKRVGYSIKLDTNGSHPDVLKELIHLRLIDYVAMDVKAPLHRYEEVIGVPFDVSRIQQSIRIIIDSGIEHEFRTTVVKSFCSEEDLNEIASLINGTAMYRIQKCRLNQEILDRNLLKQDQYTEEEFSDIRSKWEKNIL